MNAAVSSADADASPSGPADAADAGFEAAVEESLAILVGAHPETAAALVRRVLEEWPEPGVLVMSAVAASRWGIDIVPAMTRLAAGDALHGVASDYELRTGAEEAEDEADRSLDRMANRIQGADAQGGAASPPYVLAGPHPIRAAALAATTGEPTWKLSQPSASSDPEGRSAALVAMLASRLGVRLVTEGGFPGSTPEPSHPERSGDLHVGFSRICLM